MPAYNFKERFAKVVETGEKCQTIRPKRKRPTRVGDKLYLYTGMRTCKCRKLRDAVCRFVIPIEIHYDKVFNEYGDMLEPDVHFSLAIMDGFDSIESFHKFFIDAYNLSPDKPLKNMEIIMWYY